MPEYLAPGVYVEEVSSGIKPIEGVSTSTAGFLGQTERGPTGAYFITSFTEYQRMYGGFRDTKFLPDAVKGFFDNGGRRAFISRTVAGTEKVATATVPTGGFTIEAIGSGAWGMRLRAMLIELDQLAGGKKRYRLLIDHYETDIADGDFVNPNSDPALLTPAQRPSRPIYREQFDNLVNQDGSSEDIVSVVNQRSNLVKVTNRPSAAVSGKSEADARKPGEKWIKFAEGSVPAPSESALTHLEAVDDISLVIAPDDVGTVSVTAELIASCEKLRDRVVLLSAPFNEKLNDAPAHGQDSSYAAFYHPWIKVANPLGGQQKDIPAIGHIAGICARTDINRGVHKAPANEVVFGALGLTVPISMGLQERLNPKGVNCIRNFTSDNRGIRLWGARTASSDSEWKYLNVRRLFLFIEESIDQGTQWVVFEPNSDPTWAAVRRNVSNFLTSVWRSGALYGTTAEQAFFVRCDRTTMTEDDIQNGRLICVIGVAPVRPAEFVIFRISQKTLDAQA